MKYWRQKDSILCSRTLSFEAEISNKIPFAIEHVYLLGLCKIQLPCIDSNRAPSEFLMDTQFKPEFPQ